MIAFNRLQQNDILSYEGKRLVVKHVEISGSWWMVEFVNDGRNVKSLDPQHILDSFDHICPNCLNCLCPVGEVCQKCLGPNVKLCPDCRVVIPATWRKCSKCS